MGREPAKKSRARLLAAGVLVFATVVTAGLAVVFLRSFVLSFPSVCTKRFVTGHSGVRSVLGTNLQYGRSRSIWPAEQEGTFKWDYLCRYPVRGTKGSGILRAALHNSDQGWVIDYAVLDVAGGSRVVLAGTDEIPAAIGPPWLRLDAAWVRSPEGRPWRRPIAGEVRGVASGSGRSASFVDGTAWWNSGRNSLTIGFLPYRASMNEKREMARGGSVDSTLHRREPSAELELTFGYGTIGNLQESLESVRLRFPYFRGRPFFGLSLDHDESATSEKEVVLAGAIRSAGRVNGSLRGRFPGDEASAQPYECDLAFEIVFPEDFFQEPDPPEWASDEE